MQVTGNSNAIRNTQGQLETMPTKKFMAERHEAILATINHQGRVTVKELSQHFGVSQVTIRHDLNALAAEYLLQRVHGGAIRLARVMTIQTALSFISREKVNRDEKEKIAQQAAQQVTDNDCIILDASTTSYLMLEYLQHRKQLTILTNSIIVAATCLNYPHITVHMPSGQLHPNSIGLVGKPDGLPKLKIKRGFFGVKGIHSERGMMESSAEETDMKRYLIQQCDTSYFLADSSKWNQTSDYPIPYPDKTFHIITTGDIPEQELGTFRQRGGNVMVV
jgi:DeoR/GlpR family transcriptional regulator of sugar metabolism